MNFNNHTEKLLSQDEAALFLNTTKKTLNTWRCSGKYKIPYIKFGANIKYRLADLNAWLAKHTIDPEYKGGDNE